MATKPKLGKMTPKPKNTMMQNMIKKMVPSKKKPGDFKKIAKVKGKASVKGAMDKFTKMTKGRC
jgi:hypothetical protein